MSTTPDPSFSLINSVILTTDGGEIQNGMTVSLAVANDHLADQFDLSVNNITSFPVTNNVEQVVLDEAFISNIDPSAAICYFKKRTSNTILDMSNCDPALMFNNPRITYVYKVYMDASGSSAIYDVSGVDTVRYNTEDCNNRDIPAKYADVSGIRFQLHQFPFKYGDNVKLLWDLNTTEGDTLRLKMNTRMKYLIHIMSQML